MPLLMIKKFVYHTRHFLVGFARASAYYTMVAEGPPGADLARVPSCTCCHYFWTEKPVHVANKRKMRGSSLQHSALLLTYAQYAQTTYNTHQYRFTPWHHPNTIFHLMISIILLWKFEPIILSSTMFHQP
jgi:hypothetical protein